jgi:hypothetical protein
LGEESVFHHVGYELKIYVFVATTNSRSLTKAVRDDKFIDHLNDVIPNPALSGEESAFRSALRNAKDPSQKDRSG